VIERAGERGLSFNAGFEPEGYLFRPADGRIDTVGIPEFATADGLDLESDFMRDLLSGLSVVGLEVEQWSEEYGPGQIEINLRYGSALAAADGLVAFKMTFRAVARRHCLLGTFMPKPFDTMAGTGLHVHLSASPSTPGAARNLFDDPADPELGLSSLGRHALGGLLAHGEALTALGATTVNSYKRFLPGSWAPTHVMYARASRAAFVRVPERETPRRLELRVGDPAGNPYIYLTGILAAMLDGIERQIDPGPPVPGDVGSLDAEEAASRGARPLPRTLERALEYVERDETIRSALGSLILDEFIKVKRSEWDAFCAHVGEWDRSWYLERY
jgi:glutamine synthetase